MEHLAVRIGIPTAIASTHLYLHSGHVKAAFEHGSHVVFHVLTRRTSQNLDGSLACFNINDGQVAGSFHYVGVNGNESYHAIMASINGVDQVVLYLHGHFRSRCSHILGKEFYATLNGLELIFKVILPISDHFFQRLNVLLRQRQHHFGLERNGIAHVAAVPTGQTSVHFLRSEEHTSELQSRQYLVCRLLLEKKKQHFSTPSVTNTTKNIQAIYIIPFLRPNMFF